MLDQFVQQLTKELELEGSLSTQVERGIRRPY